MLRFRSPLLARLAIGALAVLAALAPSRAAELPKIRKIDLPELAKKKDGKAAAKRVAQWTDFDEWVTSLAFSPDGKTLAAGTYQAVKLWDPKEKKLQKTLEFESGYAKAVAFSPDGKLLAVGSYQRVVLWDVAAGSIKTTLKGHRAYVTGVSFSPDGTLLASSSEDETVRIWDVAQGKERTVIRGHAYPVQAVKFSPCGKLLATAAGDENRVTRPGEVRIWDAATGEEKKTLPEHKRAATDVAFSPDGKFLVSTSVDEKVNVYELATGEALGFFGGHGRPTNSAVFTADGKTVITGSGGRARGKNEVKIWDRETGEEWGTLEGHKERVSAVRLAPDGKTLATAGYDNMVVLWDISPVVPGLKQKELKVGIIGLDTSHAIAFTKVLNDKKAAPEVANCRVVAAYPKGSPDIQSSVSRVPKYTEDIKKLGVEIVDTIPALLKKVDVVLLESNDGRPHLEQVLPVFKAGKTVFIDKPIAGSLTDAVAIFEAAKKYKVPVFSSSSLRYAPGAQELRNGKIGKIKSCETYSPCSIEKTHPDLFWYGIHGVETLFTVMGTGCQSVRRTVSTPDMDEVVGTWEGGRTGTFRGYRKGGKSGYGGTATGEKGTADVGGYGGYRPLVVEIVKFFRTGKPPVTEKETLEVYAFMEAADESKRQNGAEVKLETVLEKAREAAKKRLAELD